MIYRRTLKWLYQYNPETNMCVSVSASVFMGDQWKGHEQGLIGYHDKWLGEDGRYENENKFMLDTADLIEEDFNKQFSLLMCKVGMAIETIHFSYSGRAKTPQKSNEIN